jgi:PAS domain S-box-containing protein
VENVTEFMQLQQKGREDQQKTQVLETRAQTMQSELFSHVKRVEEEQERYRRLTTLLPIGIFHTDAQGDLRYVNAQWETMTRLRWIELTSKTWLQCLPDSQKSSVLEEWRSKPRESLQVEYRTPSHSDQDHWWLLHLVPEWATSSVKTEESKAVLQGYLGYLLDITERKQAEEAQRQRAEALSELDRAKTIFFSNISHELRTPLTLILGPAKDSLDERGEQALPPRQCERLQIIQRNAQRLLKLVNSLLDFVSLEAGRLTPTYEPTDLALLTGGLADMFRPAMGKAGLGFQVELKSLTEPVYIDRDLWEKIIFNLLSNALKYTLTGEVSVTLREETFSLHGNKNNY